ncbi:tail fiber assembly protein [Yersinia enterocolitica]|uniref:tail fiber assembly protein n=1 Tax=Yersinia enterocolitica TaxID=630 RepID=UPI0028B45EF2|nr:tail fiber assembly protein [Yersinia enterocolitica]ELI7993197.1 tail fiber assembly protein [Yersinia enterocolitica]ELW7357696.1 tail fiber assembly protein [Yersinia enterocolitica]ELX2284335.1 tail fiber assembly protein [Yersinia enterocolitica]EMA2898571.1 tail fiber assembly protein [Yersinia enterocolitica]
MSQYYPPNQLHPRRCNKLLRVAADAEIEWRQYAVDKGIATEEESTALDEWNLYRVQLMRIDASKAPDIEWPTPPVK